MAARSILDIDVNDQQFNAFSEKFEKYRVALGKLPKDWAKVTNETERTQKSFEAIAAALLASNSIAGERAKRERSANDATRASANSWRDIAKSTRDVAGNVLSITGSILKWTGIAGIFSGLVGAGSLFGIERMASNVAGTRRSSQGLGVSYGEEKAFGVNYGSLVDPHSFLSSVNDALHDVTKRTAFFGAGMTQSDMQGGTAKVAENLLDRLKKIADNTDPAVLSNVMQAFHLDEFTTLADMLRLRAASPAEYADMKSGYAVDAKDLDLAKQTQDLWRKFVQQMDRAGDKIENTFAASLVNLAPSLKDLSGSFVNLVSALGKSETVKHWVDEAAEGIENFAKTVSTDEFKDKVLKFTENVGHLVDNLVKLGGGILRIMNKLGIGESDTPSGPLVPNSPLALNAPGTPEWEDEGKRLASKGIFGTSNKFYDHAIDEALAQKDNARIIAAAAKAKGISPSLLWSTYGAESSYGANPGMSPKGAMGPFQFMPPTAWDNGVMNPADLEDSARGMATYYSKLLKRFHGNVAAAIGGENWGEGNMEAFLKTGKGLNGKSGLPDETRDHIVKIMTAMRNEDRGTGASRQTVADAVARTSPNQTTDTATSGGGSSSGSVGDWRGVVSAITAMTRQMSGQRVEIYNNTGANVIAQTNQIAH